MSSMTDHDHQSGATMRGAPPPELERAEIEVHGNDTITVVIGTQPSGQGHETSFAQVVADMLQTPVEQVSIVLGDTDVVSVGGGSHSGRSMRHAGTVMAMTSASLITEAKRRAAKIFEADATGIVFEDGAFVLPGTNHTIGLFELARQTRQSDGPLAFGHTNEMHTPPEEHFMTPIRVIAFPGAPNLPTFAAIQHGFFADNGLDVTVAITPSSVFQAEKMSEGAFEIAFTAFDNVVAYSEGQGAKPGLDPDYCVISGATQLELGLIAQPDITTHQDLAGKSVALDALATGFAFVLIDMLERQGVPPGSYEIAAVGATPQRWNAVKSGEHAATISIEPFTSIARKQGFSLVDVSTNLYAAYQGGIIAARRPWLAENADIATAFLRGYLQGLAWTLDPSNREAAEALLLERMPEIQPMAAKAVMASLMSPKSGLTPHADIVPDGMREVLALRSRFGKAGVTLTEIDRYLELGCLEKARAAAL
eukprot:gene2025-2063_t